MQKAVGFAISIVLVIGSGMLLEKHVSDWARTGQARIEMMRYREMLVRYQLQTGKLPPNLDPVAVLKDMLATQPTGGVGVMEGLAFHFSLPKLRATGNAIIDPWGIPYKLMKVNDSGSQILLIISSGPDRKLSLPERAVPDDCTHGVWNRDNIVLQLRLKQ